MWSRMTGLTKAIIMIVVVAGLVAGGRYVVLNYAPAAKVVESVVPQKGPSLKMTDEPTASSSAASAPTPVAVPGAQLANVAAPEMRCLIWAWNSQIGWIYANGGPQ